MFQDKKFFFNIYILLIAILFASCTKEGGESNPEKTLENYIRLAINAKTVKDKSNLTEYFVGEALEKFQKMSDKEFLEKLVKPKYKFVHFTTRDLRKQNDGSVSVVYELVYENKDKKSQGAKITVRKIAYLTSDADGIWKIRSTRNVKSFIEVHEGMNVQYP